MMDVVINGVRYIPAPIANEDTLNIELIRSKLPFTISVKLYKNGIKTIGDLTSKREMDLLKIKGFGRGSLQVVQAFMSEYGLRIKGQFDV